MIRLLHEIHLKSLEVLRDERIADKKVGLTSVANEYKLKYKAEVGEQVADERFSRKEAALEQEITELQKELLLQYKMN